MELTAVFQKVPEGYIGFIEELPGANTQGSTLEETRENLREAARITRIELPEKRFAFWHDRAVFHFLTAPAARRSYVAAVRRALEVNGHIVVATFGPRGPEQCSGLDVMRYDADALHGEFGGAFRKIDSCIEDHSTPWVTEQEFMYCYCRMQ